MTYPKQLEYRKAVLENGYTIYYEAHETSDGTKWMGSYKVLKASLVLIGAAVGNTFDSEAEAELHAHDLAVEYVEKHVAESQD
ncbi:hypothetical protein [Pseudoduganella violacea]|uniref:Uncharacterized protein n=1 Tax=Pseudoduganella violacea TaxID=1715466 RepID=A0A7W5BAM2_9BURK|nr:hypothetical protein [Pseudoduganella violacea]MBB3118875.1 hypothetical protein [Pseudoduganella violacea]